jgi:hypothetical protein
MKINITDITIDESMQVRAGLDEPTVSQYEESLREGAAFPQVLVWAEGGAYILLDGFHRVEAMRRAGFIDTDAKQFTGSKSEATIAAVVANARHGLRLTGKDLRAAIAKLIRCGGDLSNSQIADACSCSGHTVAAVRESEGLQVTRVVGKDGKSYPSRIERKPRGEPDEKEPVETNEPPPDTGIGGESLSPETIAKDGQSAMTKVRALDWFDAAIHAVESYGLKAVAAEGMAVKAWIKSL